MSDHKPWDITSGGSLEAWVEWQRKRADALIVVIIRPDGGAIAVDPLIDVIDVHDRLWEDVPKMLGALRKSRDEQQAIALRKEARKR